MGGRSEGSDQNGVTKGLSSVLTRNWSVDEID